MNRFSAALAAAALVVGLLVGATGAVLVGAGTNNNSPDYQAQMYRMMGGQYGPGMMGGAGMMGGQWGPGMMGPWSGQSPQP